MIMIMTDKDRSETAVRVVCVILKAIESQSQSTIIRRNYPAKASAFLWLLCTNKIQWSARAIMSLICRDNPASAVMSPVCRQYVA